VISLACTVVDLEEVIIYAETKAQLDELVHFSILSAKDVDQFVKGFVFWKLRGQGRMYNLKLLSFPIYLSAVSLKLCVCALY